MKQTYLFTKTRKESPRDEVSKNAELLIRGGYIDKLHSGVYTYLPLGLRVLKKIEHIIREEMNTIGGQEILMPSLHPKENWEQTGRWDTMDDLYKIVDSSGREAALGPTHEEIVVPLMKQFISSYRDLPFSAYQFQNKFRMELRAKSGILRGREFLMKDMYSFHRNGEDLKTFYLQVREAYKNIFARVGIGKKTYFTFASGGSFSQYSHEFQTITPAGEDTIYICTACRDVAINEEIKAVQKECPSCGGNEFEQNTSIEVGNIFELKTKFSAPFELTFKTETGESQTVVMGCYGIGLGRLLGTVVEILSDVRGIIWPESIAPFLVHLVELRAKKQADELYEKLMKMGVEILYDEREISAGEKFADSDLMGIPYRIVVSEKTATLQKFEIKERKSGEVKMLTEPELMRLFQK